MQLANLSGEPDQRQISPKISAALMDSLFETQGPVHVGIFFLAVAASLTALKTGENLVWACVGLLLMAGAIRAFDLQRYQARKASLMADEAEGWKKRYQIGAMIQASAIGIWGFVTMLCTDDAVAH